MAAESAATAGGRAEIGTLASIAHFSLSTEDDSESDDSQDWTCAGLLRVGMHSAFVDVDGQEDELHTGT